MTATGTSWDEVRAAFQRIWGYEEFRAPQGEIVQCLLDRQDALVIMPTGGGKSICFQLPALLQTGLTLVISPLVALMENQVQELRQRKLAADLLHTERSPHQRRQTLWALEHQRLRLLYLSPETLLSASVWERLCQPQMKINGLILDEAHCLVQWGETFRPAYRRLGAVRDALLVSKPEGTRIAIAAFTATADPQAQQIIQRVLQLQQPQVFRLNPYRANLRLMVQTVWSPRARRQQVLKFVQARRTQSGLVYVRTRGDSESLAEWLGHQGYPTAAYHAGLSPEERRALESDWLKGDMKFVICTSAFGMGINKSDCRWIVHFHIPVLLSEYVQEVGRAGRDGKPADALTLISEPTGWLDPEDKQRQQFFQDKGRSQQQMAQRLARQLPPQGEVNAVARQFKDGAVALALLHSTGQLEWQDPFHYVLNLAAGFAAGSQLEPQVKASQDMAAYLKTKECRWKFILKAFGFLQDATNMRAGCGKCDRCLSQKGSV